MGGKPLKPKIQAYVEQRWFDEFEVYRDSHNLNQSKALEKILAEYFGGSSESLSSEVNTAAASPLVDALRAELLELRQEVEQRLQLVETRLAVKSAVSMSESANELVARLAEEATTIHAESAVSMQGLADKSAIGFLDIDACSAKTQAVLDPGLAVKSAIESALEVEIIATDESIESAASSAIKSAVEGAIAVSSLDDVVEPAAPASESVEVNNEAILLNPSEDTTPVVSKDVDIAIIRNTLGDAQDNLPVEFSADWRKTEEEAIASDSELAEVGEVSAAAKKSGKKLPGAIKKLVEEHLVLGQQYTTTELAALIDVTAAGIRYRRNTRNLDEWGLRSVPGSKPEEFERT